MPKRKFKEQEPVFVPCMPSVPGNRELSAKSGLPLFSGFVPRVAQDPNVFLDTITEVLGVILMHAGATHRHLARLSGVCVRWRTVLNTVCYEPRLAERKHASAYYVPGRRDPCAAYLDIVSQGKHCIRCGVASYTRHPFDGSCWCFECLRGDDEYSVVSRGDAGRQWKLRPEELNEIRYVVLSLARYKEMHCFLRKDIEAASQRKYSGPPPKRMPQKPRVKKIKGADPPAKKTKTDPIIPDKCEFCDKSSKFWITPSEVVRCGRCRAPVDISAYATCSRECPESIWRLDKSLTSLSVEEECCNCGRGMYFDLYVKTLLIS